MSLHVLVIGPDLEKSKGGMATVIKEIRDDKELNKNCNIDIYSSYVDGNKIKIIFYSIFAFVKFALTKKSYDIYHIHAASYGSIFRKGWYVNKTKKWGKKVILHIHGAKFMEFYAQLSERKKCKVKKILRSADMVIALSPSWKEKFDNSFGLTNCVVLENGINVEKLSNAISNIADTHKNFLMLGRLGQRKGTYDLIEAIDIARESVPDIKCYLAGDGEIDKATKIIKEKNLEKNIEVVGWADDVKKVELLRKVATVVLPSYNEGLPMAILEGMACGKAIISTTVGAIPEVISTENGFLVKPGDIDALANSIISFCHNVNLVKSMSNANLKLIKSRYSVFIMHSKLLGFYNQVLN